MKTAIPLLLVSGLAFLPLQALAQEESSAPDATAEATQAEDSQAEDTQAEEINSDDAVLSAIQEIVDSREETLARIDRINQELDLTTSSIEQADAYFDEMIDTLQEAAEIGNPDGQFVARLARLEEMAQSDAAAAKNAGYSDFEQEFLQDAEIFREQSSTAQSEWESLERRIRAIEAERERVTFLIKLARYDDAQELVEQGLGELRTVGDRMEAIEKGLRQANPDSIPD